MVTFGCLAHFDHTYADDVAFAKENGFSLLQIWYDRNGISLNRDTDPLAAIADASFPFILHAVLDINDFDAHIPRLCRILETLGSRELIIHPVCESEPVTAATICKLSDHVARTILLLKQKSIALYLENNSRLDPVFSSAEEIAYLYLKNPDVGFLLDIAHIDNYEHLKSILEIKSPDLLHLADRHLEVIHEHLPVGDGNIDFKFIFNELLRSYDGRIILEITQSSRALIASKEIIESYVRYIPK